MGMYKRHEIEREDRELAERRATIKAMYNCIYGVNLQSEPDVMMNERRVNFAMKTREEY